LGVEFGPFEVGDATNDPQASAHYAFLEGDVGDSVWKPLRDDIGFMAGRLNIYWVDTVCGGIGSGWSNFGAQVVMGKNTGDELLSYEIGHAFSLTHTDGNANFDATNVMGSAGNTRQFMTEVQLFRAHLNPSSGWNILCQARPEELTRACSFGDSGSLCIKAAEGLW